MKIVCLDGYTLNPGDLSWDGFAEFGEFTAHDRTAPDALLAACGGAEILLTNKTPLRRETLQQLDNLRYIGVLASGYDVVDLACAAQRNVTVTNVPGYAAAAVAEMIFALIFELWRNAGLHGQSARNGDWSRNPDYCYWLSPQVELAGKTLGIAGFGATGRRAAKIAHGFGMNILACGRPGKPLALTPDEKMLGVTDIELEPLLAQSDVVALCCPLTADNRMMIDAARLNLMKRGALLINTSRGLLIDEAALAAALNEERIGGAGLDVLSREPPPPDNPLLSAKNCLVTPHLAWTTREARERLLRIAVDNLKCFLAGSPRNVLRPG